MARSGQKRKSRRPARTGGSSSRQVEEARYRLAAIVESSEDAIISKNLDGIITSWNAAAETIFGYKAEEMVGRPMTTIIPPALQAEEFRILETLRKGGRIAHFETTRVTKAGELIEVSLTVSPVLDEKGRVIGAANITRDITQRKKAEQALRTSERLASVGRLAATVAHEINNPLEAVVNLVYLAKQHAISKEVRDYLATAEQELERVSHLTKQTLGFYRNLQGAALIRPEALLRDLCDIFSAKTRNKRVDIRLDLRDDPEVLAISGEIRQLFANLLSNSIDAIGDGGVIRVRVSSAREKRTEARKGLRVTIADSGPGILPADRAKLFEPFFTTKEDVGTGLGLWVCKTIADKHGGSIRVRSSVKPGSMGTTFSVFLPLRPPVLAIATEALRRAV